MSSDNEVEPHTKARVAGASAALAVKLSHPLMEVLLEDCPGEPEAERIEYAVSAVASHVPDPELVQIVVSDDFVGSVQDRTADPAERASYDTNRLFGTVGGKTILSEETLNSTIAFPWETFTSVDLGLLYRLAAHEALHAALHQRGETLTNLRIRLGLDENRAASVLAALAGIAAEEYRVERAIDDEGMTLSPTYASLVPETLVALRSEIVAGLALQIPGGPIGPTYNAILGAFHQTNLLFAYVAAEQLSSAGETTPITPDDNAARLVGRHYDEFREQLARLTSATEPTRVEDLVPIAEDLAMTIYEWLYFIGFDLDDVPTGLWFEILRRDF